MFRWLALLLGLALSLAVLAPTGLLWAQTDASQTSGIVVLDTDRLFVDSKLGQRLLNDYEVERAALIARNEQLEAALVEEEQKITDMRDTLTPEEFRTIADAFDQKAQRIRSESEATARELVARRERAPTSFLRLVEPVLASLMNEIGATVMLNARTVLLRADRIDITDIAIARIDAAYENQQPLPETAEPAETPGSEPAPSSD